MTASAELEFVCSDAGVLRGLSSVLAPDNEGVPRGLRLSMEGEGRTLRLEAESPSASVAVSTVLAILRDVALYQEVWLLSHGSHGRVRRG